MDTRIEITADLVGAFWWPVGEEWIKEHVTFDVSAYQRRCVNGGRGERGISLREAVDGFATEHGGDSSNGVELANAVLSVTREERAGASVKMVRRDFPLEMFPSVSDFIYSGEAV